MKTFIQTIRQRYHLKDYKFSLVALVLAISIIGVFIVGSAQASLQGKQAQGVVLGVIAMVIISLIDYEWVLSFHWVMYAVNFVLLAAVLLIGVNTNGATRWLNLGFIQFQPSDLTKIITILFYAKLLMKWEQSINNKRFIMAAVVLMLPSLVLIYKQPNLSTTICLAMLFCVLMYIGGLSYKFIGTMCAIFIPLAVILFIIVIQPNQPLIHQYQQNRILAWLEPEKYESEEAYQQLNSIMAIGSGQLTGKGYNSTATTSVKNGNFISEPQTDFIYAVIGEEFGFVGGCSVIVLLIFISIECIMVARRAKDLAGTIIASGIGTLIGFQGIINIAVATRVIPNTGIPLPFVSYGLTSLVSSYIGIGFVLNVRLQCKK